MSRSRYSIIIGAVGMAGMMAAGLDFGSAAVAQPPPGPKLGPEFVSPEETVARLTCPSDVSRVPKQGRNELCACGSGVKYKRCHGA